MSSLSVELVKVLVLGSPKVGKSAFIARCLENSFSDEHVPLDVSCTRYVQTQGNKIQRTETVEVSERKSPTETESLIKGANAFVVLYAIHDNKSLKKAIKICKKVQTMKDSTETPLILIGHKRDSRDDVDMHVKKRKKRVQRKLSCIHVDASAKADLNVLPVFQALIDMACSKIIKDRTFAA